MLRLPRALPAAAACRGAAPARVAGARRQLSAAAAVPASLLRVSDEVADALAHGRPVVALESTIVSHGMAWPHNMECALGVEAAVREHGGVPATRSHAAGRGQGGG